MVVVAEHDAPVGQLDTVSLVGGVTDDDARQEERLGAVAKKRADVNLVADLVLRPGGALFRDPLLLAENLVLCRGAHDIQASAGAVGEKQLRRCLACGGLWSVAVRRKDATNIVRQRKRGSAFL